MNPILLIGVILGSWILLLVLSGERFRRVQQIQAEIQAQAEQAAREKQDAEKPIIVG